MPSELTKKEAQAQQVQQRSAAQGARDVETREHHAKASASVRLPPRQDALSELFQHPLCYVLELLGFAPPSFTFTRSTLQSNPPRSLLFAQLPLISAKPASPISPPLFLIYKVADAQFQGGLNLNLFGALSGALSSTSKKTTHTNADGSSTSVEDRHDQGKGKPRLSPSATAVLGDPRG